jgi:phosphohistidine phosphatase
MRAYFLRHGEADWTSPDVLRRLTDKGFKEMKDVAAGIAGLHIEPGAILTSPLRRTVQTAEIVAAALGMTIAAEPMLAPGFNPAQLAALFAKYGGADLLLVGHEPDFSGAIRALTGGEVKMPSGALARVDIIDPQAMRGQLIWLIPPKIFRTS